MTGAGMFSEFLNILSSAFSMLFVSKYLYAFLGIGTVMSVSLIRFIVRWFNA